MNLKQVAAFTMLAGFIGALTAGTVAAAVAEPGGTGDAAPDTAAAGPPLPGTGTPFEPETDPESPVHVTPEPPSTSGEQTAGGTAGTVAPDEPDAAGDQEPAGTAGPSGSPDAQPSAGSPGDATPGDETPSSPGTGEATAPPTAPYTDGYLPPQWVRGVGVACGSPVADLPDGDRDLTTEITGRYDAATGTLPVTITGTVASDDVLGAPILVWSQGGVVVDMGMGWHEADFVVAEALAGQGEWSGLAIAPPFSTCQEDTDETAGMGLQYDNVRAPGDYEVRVVTLHTVQQDGGGRLDRLEVGAPVEVTIR